MKKKIKCLGAIISSMLCLPSSVRAGNLSCTEFVAKGTKVLTEHSNAAAVMTFLAFMGLNQWASTQRVNVAGFHTPHKPSGDVGPAPKMSELKTFGDLKKSALDLWKREGFRVASDTINNATVVILDNKNEKHNRTYFCPGGNILSPFYALDASYVQNLSLDAKKTLLDGGLPPENAPIVDIRPLILESLAPVLQNLVDFANKTLENDIRNTGLSEDTTKLSFADVLSLFKHVMGKNGRDGGKLTSLDLVTKLFLGRDVPGVIGLFDPKVEAWLMSASALFSFLSPGMFLLKDDQMSIKRLITKGVNIPNPMDAGYKNIVPFDFLTTFPIVGVHTGSTHKDFEGKGCLKNYNPYSGTSVTNESQNVVIMPSNGCISPARDQFDDNGTLPIILSRIDGNTVCVPFGLNNKTSNWVKMVLKNDLHLTVFDESVQNNFKEVTTKLTRNQSGQIEISKKGTNLPNTLRDMLEKYVDSFLKNADVLCGTINSIWKTVINSDLSSKLEDLLKVLRNKRLIDNITLDSNSLNDNLKILEKLQPLFERKVNDADIQKIATQVSASTTHINSDSESGIDDDDFYKKQIKAFAEFENLSELGKKAKYLAHLFEKTRNPGGFLCMDRVPATPEDAENLINEGMKLVGDGKNEDADNKFKEAINIMEKALNEQGIPWGNAEIDYTCLT